MKQRKAPQRILPRGIALVFHDGKVLLHQREERLLQGLWCFPGFDHVAGSNEVAKQLDTLGIKAEFVEHLGEARHVFTHIIWEMELLRFDAATNACPPGWRWADKAELAALPLPTAMKVPRALAQSLLP